MKRGRFITFEGADGTGKSTQVAAISKALDKFGIPNITTREPGGSQGAEDIRQLLLHGNAGWSPRTEALLFAAARSDHIEKTIEPALKDGTWVLCDRYIDSTMAYQTYKDKMSAHQIWDLFQISTGGYYPDRTLLLTTDEVVAFERRKNRNGTSDNFEMRNEDFHKHVRDSYMQSFIKIISSKDGWQRIHQIDANQTVELVTESIITNLLPYIDSWTW